jgi:hypothetical protein
VRAERGASLVHAEVNIVDQRGPRFRGEGQSVAPATS